MHDFVMHRLHQVDRSVCEIYMITCDVSYDYDCWDDSSLGVLLHGLSDMKAIKNKTN